MQLTLIFMIKYFIYSIALFPICLLAQVKPAYNIFNAEGKTVS